jgi:phage terminase small subunit
VPTLRNPRHERFAHELAAGQTADAAYVLAGYRENRSNAARLNANREIQGRVAEIQSMGAERAAVTVETLIAEAEAARSKAMREKGGAAAAIAAITAKAKLAGLWREKVAQTDPSGENISRKRGASRRLKPDYGRSWYFPLSVCAPHRSIRFLT